MKPTPPWNWTVEDALKKYDKLKQNDIDQLKTWLKGQPHLPPIPDEQLVLFHHACMYEMDKTKETVEKCYTMRTKVKDLFSNRDPAHKYIKEITETVICTPLRGFDSEGNQILWMKLHNLDPERYFYGASLKQIIMSLDAIQLEYGPVPGYIFILDGKGYAFSHMLRSSIMLCKRFIAYSQEGSTFFPKSIHILNVSSILDKAVAVAKPFMKSDLFSVIEFHKPGRYEFLQELLPIDIIPDEYGGKGGPLTEIHDEHLAKMQLYRDWFLEEEKLRIDESKLKSAKGTKGSAAAILKEEEMEPSLRTLAID